MCERDSRKQVQLIGVLNVSDSEGSDPGSFLASGKATYVISMERTLSESWSELLITAQTKKEEVGPALY
jgi:hypothetical protein